MIVNNMIINNHQRCCFTHVAGPYVRRSTFATFATFATIAGAGTVLQPDRGNHLKSAHLKRPALSESGARRRPLSQSGRGLFLKPGGVPFKKRKRLEQTDQKASYDEFGLMSVRKTKNNTHCSISRLFGSQKTLWNMSGGMTPTIGSKSNGRRKSRYCQRMLFKAATEKLFELGLKYLVIHCIGRALSKRYIFRHFYRRFRIVLLKDLQAVAHNGCRPRKARRL